MDEIETMRQLRDDFTPPTHDLTLARARHRLIERIEVERCRPQQSRPRRLVKRRLVVGVALTAAVSVVTLGLVTPGNDAPRADAAAVAALTSASENVRQLELPVTKPGQYLLQKRVQVTWGSAGGADRQILTGSDGEPVVWATERTDEVWIPHDADADWVVRERVRPTHFASKDAITLAGPAEDHLWKAPRGIFGSHWRYEHPSAYEKRFASYPRDPEELLAYVRAHPTGEGGSDANTFDDIGEILRDGATPADLRAALYQALTLLPDVSLVSDSVNLAGRSGVAIGYPDQGEMIFDPDTGAFIGERTVNLDFPPVPGLGADKVTLSTAVTVRVVDSAPVEKALRPPSN